MNLTAHPDATIIESDWHINILIEKRYRIYRHIFSLMILFFFLFTAKQEGEFSGIYDILDLLLIFVSFAVYSYLNMYVLIPKFFYKKRPLRYFVVLSLMVGIGFIIMKALTLHYMEPHRIKPAYNKKPLWVEFLFVIAVMTPFLLGSTALKLFQRWFADSNKINELETRALESELTALRNQINPHFLFNMLNNVNVLTKNDPAKASLVLLKLSDFLRYHLYENNQKMVLLTSEIKFILDFVNLEKLRRDNLIFTIRQDQSSFKGIMVPPNIFISFIENAVKHSADSNAPSEIHIAFDVVENKLEFTCTNTKPGIERVRTSGNGLGLSNVKRRLELLFPGEHQILVEDSKMLYKMKLTIPV